MQAAQLKLVWVDPQRAGKQAGDPEGVPQIAIDPHGAGMHQRVIISSDGSAARGAVKDPKSPARWMIVGILDEKEPGVPV